MRVSDAVVDSLAESGIEAVFGIPGKQTLPLNQAIGNRVGIEFIVARHETAVSHQAWGYAETTGSISATVTIPGPGDMNAMNGLKNALNDCTPLIHLAVETDSSVRGGEGIHETPPDTYDNVVKENVTVETPESTASELERGIAVARTPPKGPVRVGIPKNFLAMDVSLAAAGAFDQAFVGDVPTDAVEEASGLLAAADRPVVIAGGGVRSGDASDALRRVAEELSAPVVTTYKGKGVLRDSHPLVVGTLSGSAPPEVLDLVTSSDIALGVGTDFDAVATRAWTVEMPETLIQITLNGADIGTGYEPTVGIVGDAATALAALCEAVGPQRSDNTDGKSRAQQVQQRKDERLEQLRGEEAPFTSVTVLETLRDTIPDEAIVTVDAGGFRVWALNTFDASGPRSYVNPGSWATMGTGLPSAIGAQVAHPNRSVTTLTGDGGLLMCLHELHTAVAENLPVTVVVLNNNDYAIISEEATRSYDINGTGYAWPDAPIEFASLAESMGMSGSTATSLKSVREEVTEAVRTAAPTLVEIPLDPAEPQASEWMSE